MPDPSAVFLSVDPMRHGLELGPRQKANRRDARVVRLDIDEALRPRGRQPISSAQQNKVSRRRRTRANAAYDHNDAADLSLDFHIMPPSERMVSTASCRLNRIIDSYNLHGRYGSADD
ncbi:MAG: hypothetical protein M3Y87_34105 [Myxococcota bacterium]|nr:hypothetical protein [Myxococcota bacterium]